MAAAAAAAEEVEALVEANAVRQREMERAARAATVLRGKQRARYRAEKVAVATAATHGVDDEAAKDQLIDEALGMDRSLFTIHRPSAIQFAVHIPPPSSSAGVSARPQGGGCRRTHCRAAAAARVRNPAQRRAAYSLADMSHDDGEGDWSLQVRQSTLSPPGRNDELIQTLDQWEQSDVVWERSCITRVVSSPRTRGMLFIHLSIYLSIYLSILDLSIFLHLIYSLGGARRALFQAVLADPLCLFEDVLPAEGVLHCASIEHRRAP